MLVQQTIFQAFCDTASKNPDGPFLMAPSKSDSDRKTYSFTSVLNQVDSLSNLFSQKGYVSNMRIATLLGSSPEHYILKLALNKIGVSVVPINPDYTPDETSYLLQDSGAVLVISSLNYVDQIKEAISYKKLDLKLAIYEDLESLPPNKSAAGKETPVSPNTEASLLYTSGTTGKSKGARLTHRNLASNAAVLADTWRFTDADVLLHMLPIYHTHGLFVACNLMAMVGGSMIFLPKFSVEAALRWMPRATSMMGVPTFYTRLLASDDFTGQASRHMRLFISGSAPLLAETHHQFAARTGQAILERYGMTETNMITSNPYDGDRRAGTVGLPLAGIDLRIADAETGKVCADGEIGIIELRGDNVFQGYWEMPEKTAESFREDGFFITGDMAVRDADGYISIVGRDKDMIISGGLNVYPREVESLVDDINGVIESAVIGVPHPDFGEAVVAIVAAGDGAVSPADITAAIDGKLAKFKQPKAVRIVPSLPRNSMGKVQKAALRQTYAALFA